MYTKDDGTPLARMNSMSLYARTTQIILESDPKDPKSLQELYRLVPYLRNSLCCVVCLNLLVDPITPKFSPCQHHVCRKCEGGRKKIKPTCESCKTCKDYEDNKRLRILMQCYSKMCTYVTNCPIFKMISLEASQPGARYEHAASNLKLLFKEGAAFKDHYKRTIVPQPSAFFILPCVYTSSPYAKSTKLNENLPKSTKEYPCENVEIQPSTSKAVQMVRKNKKEVVISPSSSSLDSAAEKIDPTVENSSPLNAKPPKKTKFSFMEKSMFKNRSVPKVKKGCRCGNATAYPGKLTCCGQRCPCYVEGKACTECKCKGCRNPHREDGKKVLPSFSQHYSTIEQEALKSANLSIERKIADLTAQKNLKSAETPSLPVKKKLKLAKLSTVIDSKIARPLIGLDPLLEPPKLKQDELYSLSYKNRLTSTGLHANVNMLNSSKTCSVIDHAKIKQAEIPVLSNQKLEPAHICSLPDHGKFSSAEAEQDRSKVSGRLCAQ